MSVLTADIFLSGWRKQLCLFVCVCVCVWGGGYVQIDIFVETSVASRASSKYRVVQNPVVLW